MTRAEIDCDEFLLRLAQYWAVVCATRTDRLQKKDPADQKVTTVLLRLYQQRHAIARGAVNGIEYDREQLALRIHGGDAFDKAIGRDLLRPFKLFSRDEPFTRSIKTFARTDTLQEWRKGKSQSLANMPRLIERFQKEAGVDLREDVRYRGVLVVEKPDEGEAIIRFAPLTKAQTQAYGRDLLPRFEPAAQQELPGLAGCVVIRAGDMAALRSTLGVSEGRVVTNPVVLTAFRDVYNPINHLRIIGRPDAGKTTQLYGIAATIKDGLILILTPRARADSIADFLKTRDSVVVIADEAQALPAGLVAAALGTNEASVIASYSRPDERIVRERHPELFRADVVPIVLDAASNAYVRDVTRAIVDELQISMTERRFEKFLGYIESWDTTPGAIKEYLMPWAGVEFDEPGFLMSDERHAPWANQFHTSTSETQKTVLRILAALQTLYAQPFTYEIVREYFVERWGLREAQLDVELLELEQAGWLSVRDSNVGSGWSDLSDRLIETDWARIPPGAFSVEALLDNFVKWSRDHVRFTDEFRKHVAVRMARIHRDAGREERAEELLTWVSRSFPASARGRKRRK